MSAPQFTPGPWRVNSMEFTAKRPQEVTFGVQAVGMEMDEANAHLIAAAPEQYSELEAVCEAIRELRLADGHAALTGDESRFDRALAAICQHENRIRVLLAKARGETP